MSQSEYYGWCTESQTWQSANNPDLFAGLLYGYGHYTSFLWPLKKEEWKLHWQRLAHDSNVLGLLLNTNDDENLWQSFNRLFSESPQRIRLTHIPLVNSFSQIVENNQIDATWLLQNQPIAETKVNEVILHLSPTCRSNAQIKHNQISETLIARRSLKQNKSCLNNFHDVVFSATQSGETILLEAGFSNLLLLDIKNRIALTPDPKQYPCLLGTKIQTVLKALASHDWQIVWDCLSLDNLHDASALFISNAAQGAIPVSTLFDSNGQKIWQADGIQQLDSFLSQAQNESSSK